MEGMRHRLGTVLAALLLTATTGFVVPAGAEAPAPRRADPRWAAQLPAAPSQVVRPGSSRDYCRRVWCTVTQAWQRGADGTWTKEREFRSTIGVHGWGK